MRGLILAAGFGSRLRPLTERIPKALIPVCGVPMLRRVLHGFADAGIEDIAVNTHHLAGEMVLFQRASSIPFTLLHEQDYIRGTGGAIQFARDMLAQAETFIVQNVDIFAAVNYRDLEKAFLSLSCAAALVARPVQGRGTILYRADDCEYAGIPDMAPRRDEMRSADFMGIAVYRRECLDSFTDEDFSIVPVWRRLRNRGLSVKVLLLDTYWCDIGTPGDLLRIHSDAITGKAPIQIPASMNIDRNRRRAVAADLAPETMREWGSNVWCEISEIAPGRRIADAVLYRGGDIGPETICRRVIVSPWGRCPIER